MLYGSIRWRRFPIPDTKVSHVSDARSSSKTGSRWRHTATGRSRMRSSKAIKYSHIALRVCLECSTETHPPTQSSHCSHHELQRRRRRSPALCAIRRRRSKPQQWQTDQRPKQGSSRRPPVAGTDQEIWIRTGARWYVHMYTVPLIRISC